jgi:hypothetical protein
MQQYPSACRTQAVWLKKEGSYVEKDEILSEVNRFITI